MTEERLYSLLPPYFRQRDLTVGEPLRALLSVLEQQGETIHANIAQLYRDWFIATSSEWAVPYIGAAINVTGLEDSRNVSFSQRARVAHTIRDRRRKGLLSTLVWALHDATGWSIYARVAYPRALLERLFAADVSFEIHTHYGPTETTVGVIPSP